MLVDIGESRELVGPTGGPTYLDVQFWSKRTHEAEACARRHLTDAEIDAIMDEVTAVIDENLLRFDPLTRYGKPAGVLIGFGDEDDWFDYCLENDPRFLKRIAAARESLRTNRGIRLEDLD